MQQQRDQEDPSSHQIKRIPLVGTFDSRDSAVNTLPTKDFQLVNCFIEKAGAEKVLVCPRRVTQNYGLTAAGSLFPNGFGVVYRTVANSVRPVVVMTYDNGVDTSMDVWRINSGSSAHSTKVLAGLVSGGSRCYVAYAAIAAGPRALIVAATSGGVASYYNPQADTVAAVTLSTNNDLAHGVALLDGYFFVLDSLTGRIYNSDLNDGTTWGATNFLTATVTSSRGVWIGTHVNYVVAFMDFTIEFFYDAGNSLGSPLGHVPNATIQVGCAAGATVADVSGTKVWVAQNEDGTRFVAMMAAGSTSIQRVSTPQVDRILQDAQLSVASSTYARGCGYDGHTFYLLDFSSGKYTLVYDMTTGAWTIWTSLSGTGSTVAFSEKFIGYLGGLDAVTGLSDVITVGTLTGKVSQLSEGSTDLGANGASTQVYAKWHSELMDQGYLGRKFYTRAAVIGDRAAFNVDISYTSDDYATYTAARTISMNQERPETRQLGNSRRRGWSLQWQNSAVNSSRLEALEVEYQRGPT